MFRSAVLKLTAWHVGAILLVCILFSVPVYSIAAGQLQRSADVQTRLIQRFYDPSTATNLAYQRDKQLRKDLNELLTKIVIANIIILGAGAVLSYEVARKTLRPLEASHKAQSRFTANASHELRTPLATMQTEIEVALRDKELNTKDARVVLQSNLEEIAHLRSLSDELLELTKLDAREIKFSDIVLTDMLQNEITTLEKRHHVKIKAELTKNVSVKGDERLLRQLLTILIDNAVKYAKVKTKPDITVKLQRTNDHKARISVIDHGIGIKPDDIENVFARFYRGSNTVDQSAGHGLGLSLAKQITDAHSGTIAAASKAVKDVQTTTFTINLPA